MAIVDFEGVELYLDSRTATQWATVTKIIPKGFACIELGDGYAKIKVGNGTMTYDKLPYIGGDLDISNVNSAITTALNEYYTKDQVDEEISTAVAGLGSVFTYKGRVATSDALPDEGNDVGDVWIVGPDDTTERQEYYWNGTLWDYMGLTTEVDLSDYYNKSSIDSLLAGKVDKVTGKGLSTNDFTTNEKNKLAGLSNYDDTEVKNRLDTLEENYISSADTITITCSLS